MLKKLIAKIKSLSKSREPVDPSIFNDPVADKTSWSPLKRGGASFSTHCLTEVGAQRLEFKAARGAKAFYLLFFFIGVGVLVLFTFTLLEKGISNFGFEDLFLLFFGSVFGTVGACIYHFGTKPIVFDKQSGYFWKGKRSPERVINHDSIKTLAKLDDIHAFQLISEYCSGDDSSYYSYELNLIRKDSTRINVVDHGKLDKIREDAQKLANFLEKPLWDAI
jgi:hypothetical protein